MHRTTFVLRSLGWSMVFGLLLHVQSARAQTPEAAPTVSVLIVPMNTTKQVQMSTKQRISLVRTENPKVIRVQSLVEDPTAVLVTGLNPGVSRVTLTDANNKVESLDVTVASDVDAAREQQRKDLLTLIRKAAPTSSVDVIAAPNNTVLLSGTAGNAENVQTIVEASKAIFPGANVVNGLKISGVQQVQLEAKVYLVNRSEIRNFGFNFEFTNPGNNGLTSITSLFGGVKTAANTVFTVVNNGRTFNGYLQALRTEGLAKIVAEPTLVTLSGQSANILSGGETPILTASTTGSPSVSYKSFGTTVKFLPIVMGNGKIHVDVVTESSAKNDANGISIAGAAGSTIVPGFDTRSAQVTVEIEDGQTLAIGGLIQNKIGATTNKVPILGDLPFIGVAFSQKSYTETEEELLIVITPRLIDPLACNQLPKYLPGRETRTPDDFELFLEGILEAPRGQRQVFPDGIHYQSAHMSPEAASMYPCGDSPRPQGLLLGGNGNCANGNCAGNVTFSTSTAVRTESVGTAVRSPEVRSEKTMIDNGSTTSSRLTRDAYIATPTSLGVDNGMRSVPALPQSLGLEDLR